MTNPNKSWHVEFDETYGGKHAGCDACDINQFQMEKVKNFISKVESAAEERMREKVKKMIELSKLNYDDPEDTKWPDPFHIEGANKMIDILSSKLDSL